MGWESNRANYGNNIKRYTMIYLTWGTGYTGIFRSQVIGVCEYLNTISSSKIKIIAFVPYPSFLKTRKEIKQHFKETVVLPMIPSRNHWWPLFIFPLYLFSIGHKKIITRGVIANQIALCLKKISNKKIVYDGRGALKAEWNEYNIVNSDKISAKVGSWERNSVINSDFRIAVSNKLVEYWNREFSYKSQDHVIIPCTVNSFSKIEISQQEIIELRTKLNYKKDDIILIYSGSSESWQSLNHLSKLLDKILELNNKVKILFLAKIDLNTLDIYKKHYKRLKQMWLKPNEVYNVLKIADYGLLYRKDSVTNQVASPTKFAEYLQAGLKIIISENIGDYSQLVEKDNLGLIIDKTLNNIHDIKRVKLKDRLQLINFANDNFTKDSYLLQYKELIIPKWKQKK